MTKITKLLTAKSALTKLNLPLDSSSFYNGLVLCGLMRQATYVSTTGSGEVKTFMALTDSGLEFGANVKGIWHEFKTEPKFFEATFPAVYLKAIAAIMAHGQEGFQVLA